MLIIKQQMIKQYDILRQKYLLHGYDSAFNYLETFHPTGEEEEILLSNFYCYISIQSEFKVDQIITILNQCLEKTSCTSSLKALTLYHISQALFKMGELNQCKEKSQKIIQEFIGEYYSLDKRLERTEQEGRIYEELQEMLYYAFLMVAYVLRDQKKLTDSKVFLEAGKRIMNERKNLMTLTKNVQTKVNSFEEGSGKKEESYNTI